MYTCLRDTYLKYTRQLNHRNKGCSFRVFAHCSDISSNKVLTRPKLTNNNFHGIPIPLVPRELSREVARAAALDIALRHDGYAAVLAAGVVLRQEHDGGLARGEVREDVDPGFVVVHADGDGEALVAVLGLEAQHARRAAAAHDQLQHAV